MKLLNGTFRNMGKLCCGLTSLVLFTWGGQGYAHALFENPAGIFTVPWTSEQIAATYATGVFNSMGLRVDNDPSRARVSERDNKPVLEGIALAFDIDDDFAFDIDQTAWVRVELDATNLDEFYIAYDRNGGPDGLIRVPVKANKKSWQTFNIKLENARFANRGYGGTDFAIAGGLDLSDRQLTIRNIEFSLRGKTAKPAAAGILELITTQAGSGERIAVQVGLYDKRGRMPLPGLMAVELQVFDRFTRLVEIREELDDLSWPHANRYSMYVDGFYRARVPAGEYTLVVTRGPEFEIEKRQITVRADQVTATEVALEHQLDMPARGWYSGDVHNHFTRLNSAANNLQMAHARAQNLHMHWLNELGNSAATHFNQYAWGEAGEYREQSYIIASAQEDPRTDYLGHVLSLGQERRVRRVDDYLRYDLAVKDIHSADGIVGIAHMDFAQFWQDVALALLLPEGLVDFVEVMQFNSIHSRDWYRFLNMGFRLPAAAGSDWPYMALPGSVRTYVHTGDEFDSQRWKNGLREGKTFVSNGPMLEFSVNGQAIGSRLKVSAGDRVQVKAVAEIVPSRDKLIRLDLIANGEIVHSVESEEGLDRLTLDHVYTIEHGGWLAVQANGKKAKDIFFQGDYTMTNIAHSSPVYLEVDGLSADSAVAIENMNAVLERLAWFREAPYARNDNEVWESPERTAELVNLQRDDITAWVDRTMDWYRERQRELKTD